MEGVNIILWAIGGGFTATWVVMGIAFKVLRSDTRDVRTDLAKLDDKVLDIDRRLCRLEGAMMNKECCILGAEAKKKVV